MRNSKSALLAALAMSALVTAGTNSTARPGGVLVIDESTQLRNIPADRGQNVPGDTKSDRLGTGYYRRHKAPVGKRYRASVKQHQRHAAKARNRAKMR